MWSSDGNIRYFEYENDKFEFLSEYKSSDPQRGVAFLPKRSVNTHENEVMRAFKTVNDSYIEPISFIVPRRSETFQEDIYPPAIGLKPAASSSAWFEGNTSLPPKIDLASLYAGEEPTEISSDNKQVPKVTESKSSAPSKLEPESEPENAIAPAKPVSAAVKGPPPSMKEQTASIKDVAAKFNDDEAAEDDDSSSFEEVAKPVERFTPASNTIGSASSKTEAPPSSRNLGDPLTSVTSKPDDFDQASQAAAMQSTQAQIQSQQSGMASIKVEPLKEQLPANDQEVEEKAKSVGGFNQSDNGELKHSLTEIKNLLEEQRKTMSAQNDTIGRLTAEVDRLRSKMDG